MMHRTISVMFIALYCAGSVVAQSVEERVYGRDRTFQPLEVNGNATTWHQVVENGKKLNGLIKGDYLQVIDAKSKEYEGVSWGQDDSRSAWNNVKAGYQSHYTEYDEIWDDPGWIKGAVDAYGSKGAYLWLLQNILRFRTSPGQTHSSNGKQFLIDKVLIGTLPEDYDPGVEREVIFPSPELQQPQDNSNKTVKYRFDTTPYYKIPLKEVDIDMVGVSDDAEMQPGGFVGVGMRKRITLHALSPGSWHGMLRLDCASDKVKLYTAEVGGIEVVCTGPNPNNKASSLAFPMDLYVEGVALSTSLADIELILSEENSGVNDRLKITVVDVDLDVDSDNNDGVNPLWTPTDVEDAIEEATSPGQYGKIVFVNQNDDDRDGIPDYADLEVVASGSHSGSVGEGQFVPLKLSLPPLLDSSQVSVQFDYNGVSSLNTALFAGVDIGNGYKDYTAAKAGDVRIWRNCAPDDARDAMNYVLNGSTHTAKSLGFSSSVHEKTFYIEGITAKERSAITVTLTMFGSDICSDRVAITVVDANLGVNCNNNLVNGDGMRVGIPDVPFVIDVNDDIIEDQKDGFEFWWARDKESDEITELGLVDLCPFVVDVPQSLLATGFKFYLKTDTVSLDVYPAVSPSMARRQFLLHKPTADAQIAQAGRVLSINSTPLQIPITQAGKNEFLFKAQGDNSGTAATFSLMIESPNSSSGLDHRFEADSVKLTLKRTRDFYPMMSSRGTPIEDYVYHIEDGRTKTIKKYPDAVKLADSGPEPDSAKSKYLVVMHGYNVSEAGAYDQIGEAFRRTYWFGFRGNYIGYTWHGNEWMGPVPNPVLAYGADVENAFQTAPCFLDFVKSKVLGACGGLQGNVYVWAHSLGNQVVLDALRLYQANTLTAGSKLVHAYTCIEAAVWGDTFYEQTGITYSAPSDPISYTVDDLKDHSWAFYFNQAGHASKSSVDRLIHSWNAQDYALSAMRYDEVFIRNPGARQYDRPNPLNSRIPVEYYSGGAAFAIDLAHEAPVLLQADTRKEHSSMGVDTCLPNDVERCLGERPNPSAGVIQINANSYGWHIKSHSSFVGKEALPSPAFDWMTGGASPLHKIAPWFVRLRQVDAYPVNVE